MEAVDAYIPEPQPVRLKSLSWCQSKTCSRSLVVAQLLPGRIERGIIKVGQEVEIVGILEPTTKTVCDWNWNVPKTSSMKVARATTLVVCLRGTKKGRSGNADKLLAVPGSIKPHKKFKCEAYILTKEEGGRHTPFFTNYRPQFYFRTTDVTGVVWLPESWNWNGNAWW